MKNVANQRLGQMELQAQVGQDAHWTGPQEWHKTDTCHNCGEVGHIKPLCPKYDKTDAKTGGED